MQSSVINNLLKENNSGLPVKDFLAQVAAAHPYFAPAHFFLLQRLNEADPDFEKQAAKTSLLFNNPHWLNFQLQEATQKETPVVTMYAVKENENKEEAEASTAIEATQQPQALLHTESISTDTETSGSFTEIANTTELEVQAAEPMAENTDNDDDNAILVTEEAPLTESPAFKLDLEASIKSAENVNAPAFEPMHLVDYFASQGIKLSEEVQSADKLGKQLKSFTEWLKTMKKVHAPDAVISGQEIAVQAMAEKSNTENEVITEAMADVFVQQGKTAKAIELYEKLSLLNTAKSAYFAAKIQNLKGE